MPSLCTRILVCTLGLASLGLSAAVENVSPGVAGETPYCNMHYTVQSGDTCWDVILQYGSFTINQFLCWNPDINASCTNLIPGRPVCVGVRWPGPRCYD
ncbi:uncharacterized protein N7473_007079 [Penicillium subrubescens]|uniref:LysM domain-containing protein n=1 Tax=Penicillium subrubescens TaxID=1316194 RepID=A0A1Q5TGC4_9EURO|nr:uncharacterized protein N7473_007079 [Penicillium subrubescens]KAJ5890851.1 hypothetical protein N7473_007079 [Penicillium subrubescens]OKO99283.1 hypothetical protein PENSUB_8670 [Penicillium subrubescens]